MADAVHGRSGREASFAAASVLFLFLWGVMVPGRLRMAPGMGPTETREVQIARGRALRARGVGAVEVVPCQYEYFALVAAFEAPERVTVRVRSQGVVTDECPVVVER